jgi:hypothetical protein
VASAARSAAVVGLGAGAEPQLQLEGLGALEDGVLLRQIHAAHAPRQRAADGVGLAAVVDQHGQVGLAQRAQAIVAGKAGLAALAQVEEAHHLAGADVGHGFEVGALGHRLAVVGRRQAPDVEGRQRLAVGLERVLAPVGVGEEGHRVARRAAEQEGAGPSSCSSASWKQRLVARTMAWVERKLRPRVYSRPAVAARAAR